MTRLARLRLGWTAVQPGRQAGGVVDQQDERGLQYQAEVHRRSVLECVEFALHWWRAIYGGFNRLHDR